LARGGDGRCAQAQASDGRLLGSSELKYHPDSPIKWQALLWAGFSEPTEQFVVSDLRAAVIGVSRSLNYKSRSGPLSWLDEQEYRRLYTLLGEGFISRNLSTAAMHQSVITVKQIDRITSDRVSVDLQAWESLSEDLQHLQDFRYSVSTCPSWLSKSKNTVLFLQPTAIEAVDRMQMTNMYKAIRLIGSGHGAHLRGYPNEVELEKEHHKLGDIEALDYIADRAAEWKYQYRPRTCFRPGRCTLAEDERSVHKRTNSDCAKHVKVQSRSVRYGLICELPNPEGQQMPNSRKKTLEQSSLQIMDSGERWFHQEYVATLAKAEYRVFIVAEPGSDSLRGRTRRILKIILTSSAMLQETSIKSILAHVQTPQNCPQYEELQEFALHIFDELRRLPGAKLQFESLDVGGVRLDIATSEPDAHTQRSRFFVNEITRWHSAYFFSRWVCPDPHTQICDAFAAAFCSYFFPEESAGPSDTEADAIE
jgi:hypothetical protein